MNKIFLLLLLAPTTQAQTAYNPFTQNIHFAPEPTILGFECNSNQQVCFTQGITTAADATDYINNPLKVNVCIQGFEFNTGIGAITGSYATYFTWQIISPTCLQGTQNQTLFGTGSNPMNPNTSASGWVMVSLHVPAYANNTILSVNVTLDIPQYMQEFNSLPDDNESIMTQSYCNAMLLPVEVLDFYCQDINSQPKLSWSIEGINEVTKIELVRYSNKLRTSIPIGLNVNSYVDNDAKGMCIYTLVLTDVNGNIFTSKSLKFVCPSEQQKTIKFNILGQKM